jgi:hypothetical protein
LPLRSLNVIPQRAARGIPQDATTPPKPTQ